MMQVALVQGVTVQLTLGVVKNIIPAIASTNAIVAAACTLEALKLVTMCSTGLDNYMMCACPGFLQLQSTLFCSCEPWGCCDRVAVSLGVVRLGHSPRALP